MLIIIFLIDSPCFFEILRSMNYTDKVDTVAEGDIKDDMGFGDEAAKPLRHQLWASSPHHGLLRDVGNHVIDAAKILVGA